MRAHSCAVLVLGVLIWVAAPAHAQVGVDSAVDFKDRTVNVSGAGIVDWKFPLYVSRPGVIVQAGDRILVGARPADVVNPKQRQSVADAAVLVCLSATDGSTLWQATHPRLKDPYQDSYGMPIYSVPAVDEGRVYYVSNRGELMCLDLEGFYDKENDGPIRGETQTAETDADVVWSLDMPKALGVKKRDAVHWFNPISSPLVLGDLVYCVTGHGVNVDLTVSPAPSFVAVNKRTGQVVWQHALEPDKLRYAQWSSPVEFKLDGKSQVVFPGGDGVIYGFEPRAGKLLWSVAVDNRTVLPRKLGQKPFPNFYFPQLAVEGNQLFFSFTQGIAQLTNEPGMLGAVSVSGQAGVYRAQLAWTRITDPVHLVQGRMAVRDKILYAATQYSRLLAIDTATGKDVWTADMDSSVNDFGGLAIDDNRVYVPQEAGLFVFAIGAKLQPIVRYDFKDEVCCTPVISAGRSYVATRKGIVAVRLHNAKVDQNKN